MSIIFDRQRDSFLKISYMWVGVFVWVCVCGGVFVIEKERAIKQKERGRKK